jgi:DNA-binding NtrC family response regulator
MPSQARHTVAPDSATGPVAIVDTRPEPRPRSNLLTTAIAVSGIMADVLDQIRQFAPAETVVFEGATGTGKSYLAGALHEASGRRGAFVDVSAAEFHSELALDQLFGHVRGAFTGAVSGHRGLFAEAEGGTLLIDEFQLLRRSEQAKLIRALERRVYRPVGSERDVPVTCSVVVGVEENLDRLVAQGMMRANVRSRLGHCIVHVPTLDERRDEIASLAQYFLSQCPVMTHAADGPTRFTPEALALLEVAQYPANLRDLREIVKRGYLLARRHEELDAPYLPQELRVSLRYDRRMDRATKVRLVQWALRMSGGHVGRAAEQIGAHRNTVRVLREELPWMGTTAHHCVDNGQVRGSEPA